TSQARFGQFCTSASHTATRPLESPVTSRFPSGMNAILSVVAGASITPMRLRVATSQRTMLKRASPEVYASVRPSGLNATALSPVKAPVSSSYLLVVFTSHSTTNGWANPDDDTRVRASGLIAILDTVSVCMGSLISAPAAGSQNLIVELPPETSIPPS